MVTSKFAINLHGDEMRLYGGSKEHGSYLIRSIAAQPALIRPAIWSASAQSIGQS